MKKVIRRGTKRFVKGYAFMLLLCMLFSICMSAAAEGLPFSGKVVDPSTLDSWRAFFGPTADTTEYAGKVWTDKSVFADVASAKSKGDDGVEKRLLPTGTQLEGEDSFLVVLSAMASNKSIEGFEYTPTDTMLVLDMSSSMYRQGPGGGKAIKDLAKATNIALTKLLDLNQNNRVGVVIYSASNETEVLMPLDRYSTNIQEDSNGIVEYLTSDGSKIQINEKDGGVEAGFSQKTQIKGSYEYKTGTWIQDGIYRAMKQLTAADTEVKDGPQAGAKRMPIIVLMTDGNPTRYVTDYDGSSNEQSLSGNVIRDDWSGYKTVFLTQLTAAYSREQVKKHYGREPMFYTLGFNIGSGSQAEYVMDPRKIPENRDLKGYWDGYLKETGGSYTFDSTTIQRNSDVKGYAYADEYYAASSNGLAAAFEKIVQRIVLQSLYYPTEASDNRHEYGGYIEFLDDIGEFMEVKDVKGIRLNNQFYSGAAFAKMFSEMQDGQHAEEKAELLESIRVRMGLDDPNEVQALLDIAAEKGHLKYNSSSDHSNYVGWYADKDKKYIPYDSNNEPPTGDNVKYYIKSYNYIGGANTQGTGSNTTNYRATDMMYATIRVETELATGHEQVIFKVPAALIPLYSYEVKLPDGATKVENGQTVTVSRSGMNQVYPIRLIYEVGVRDDITAFNFADALKKYMQNSAHEGEEYPHKNNATGDYYLYSNKWDQDAFDKNDAHPREELNMVAWYEPSRENERFFYTHDTVVYKDNEGEAIYSAQESKPTSGYRQHFVFEDTDGDGKWNTHAHYEPIEAATLAAAAMIKDGRWVIPAGRVHRNIAGYRLWKGNYKTETDYNANQQTANPTETLAYADFPAVEFTANDPNAPYYVDAILGNNGRLTVKPETGLRITKKVNSTDAPTREFDIRISGNNIGQKTTYSVLYTDANTSVTKDVNVVDSALTIKLKPGQTATVIGLAAGDYVLTEQLDGHWAAPQVKVNGGAYTTATAGENSTYTYAVTVTDRTIAEVEFQNIYSPNGTLVLEKIVTGKVPPHNPEFTFEVTLTGGTIATSYQTSEGTAYVTDNKFSVTLKANEAVAVYGIDAGTTVSVSETNIPTGFAQVEETNIPTGFAQVEGVVYNRADREISSNEALIATITNAYNPQWQNPDKGIVIDLTKTIAGRNWKPDDRFTFKLFRFEHNEEGHIDGAVIDTAELTNTDHNSNVASITKEDVFTDELLVNNVKDLQPGTYMFHIHEEIPSVPAGGMSYESEAASFFVTIEDKEGYLTITNVESGHMTQVVEDHDKNLWKISAAFTNRYAPRNEAMFTLPVVKEILDGATGKELDSKLGQSKAGFTFVLKHEGNEVARAVSGENGMAELTVTGIKNATQPNAPLVYTLVEETSGRPGITDDTVEWTVKVIVTDDLNGTLSAKIESITPKTSDALHQPMIKLGSTYAVPFYNVYDQNKATVKIPIIKTVNNISGDKMGPEGFEFELIDDKGNRVASAKSDKDGKAVISLAFNEESVGVHKGWKVREVAGTVTNMVYSTVEYVVDIKIERVNATTTEAAYLAASVTSDGKAIEALPFENIYGSVVNLPETGDDSKLLLYVIALAAAAAGFIFLRRRKSM